MAPPRALFVDFPLGHTSGPPGDAALQDTILERALRLLEEMDSPGIVDAEVDWPAGSDWKRPLLAEQRGEVSAADDRAERSAEAQYQSDEDRQEFERRWGRREHCPTCIVPS